MPDSSAFISNDEEFNQVTFRVASECYSNLEIVEEALAQLPNFNGLLVWGSPSTPDPNKIECDVDLVLVMSDKTSLPMAMDRISNYKQVDQATILIYIGDNEGVSAKDIAGLSLPYSQLAAGLSILTQALFAPVIPQGLVCIDWADSRHVLAMDGQVMLEEMSGSQPTDLIKAAVTRLQERASGRPIRGIQASLFCSPDKLLMRHVLDLLSACKEVTDKDATLIMGAPFLDRPCADRCEVRLIAKIECAGNAKRINY